MKLLRKKTILFIEPCLSCLPLVLKAKENKHRALVISSLSDSDSLIEASSSFFQLKSMREEVLLSLVKKIAYTFTIDELIFGTDVCPQLSHKISAYFDLIKEPHLTRGK